MRDDIMGLKRFLKNKKAFSGVQALGVVTLLIVATTFVVATQDKERVTISTSFEKDDLECIASELIEMLTEEEGIDVGGSTNWEYNVDDVSSPGLAINNYEKVDRNDGVLNSYYPIDDLVVFEPEFIKTQEGHYCGDGTCDTTFGENCANCSRDCGSCCSSCGDGECNGGETTVSCCEDCGTHCGDGVCNCDETASTCLDDCGSGCTPSCYNRECGSDGCGGSCGSCNINEHCSGGRCYPNSNPCTPDCSGKECGSDGCGGSCGSCSSGQFCENNHCVTPSCSDAIDCDPIQCEGEGWVSGTPTGTWPDCYCDYPPCGTSLILPLPFMMPRTAQDGQSTTGGDDDGGCTPGVDPCCSADGHTVMCTLYCPCGPVPGTCNCQCADCDDGGNYEYEFFDDDPLYATLTVDIEGNGTVTVNPSSFHQNSYPYHETYERGTKLTISAESDPKWRFDHWSVDVNRTRGYFPTVPNRPLTSTENPVVGPLLASMTITAHFVKEEISYVKGHIEFKIRNDDIDEVASNQGFLYKIVSISDTGQETILEEKYHTGTVLKDNTVIVESSELPIPNVKSVDNERTVKLDNAFIAINHAERQDSRPGDGGTFYDITNTALIEIRVSPLALGKVGDFNWSNNVASLIFQATDDGNHAPYPPAYIAGPRIINIPSTSVYNELLIRLPNANEKYEYFYETNTYFPRCAYSTCAFDPDGDDIQIRFDWDVTGGSDITDWSGWVHSIDPAYHPSEDQIVTMYHVWDTPGTYYISAQARDNTSYAESTWKNSDEIIVELEDDPFQYFVKEFVIGFGGICSCPEGCIGSIIGGECVCACPPSTSQASTASDSAKANSEAANIAGAPVSTSDLINRYNRGSGSTGALLGFGAGTQTTTAGFLCLVAGTEITLADGSCKKIEDIRSGDKVLSFDAEKKELVNSYVTGVKKIMRNGIYSINDGLIEITDDHPLLVRKDSGKIAWAAVNPLKSGIVYAERESVLLEVGDEMFTKDSWVKVESIESLKGNMAVYTFAVSSNVHNYFANDVLVSNSKIVIGDHQESDTAKDYSFSVISGEKIMAFSDIDYTKLKKMLDIPENVEIRIKINSDMGTSLDYPPGVTFENFKNKAQVTKNILISSEYNGLYHGSITVEAAVTL